MNGSLTDFVMDTLADLPLETRLGHSVDGNEESLLVDRVVVSAPLEVRLSVARSGEPKQLSAHPARGRWNTGFHIELSKVVLVAQSSPLRAPLVLEGQSDSEGRTV